MLSSYGAWQLCCASPAERLVGGSQGDNLCHTALCCLLSRKLCCAIAVEVTDTGAISGHCCPGLLLLG